MPKNEVVNLLTSSSSSEEKEEDFLPTSKMTSNRRRNNVSAVSSTSPPSEEEEEENFTKVNNPPKRGSHMVGNRVMEDEETSTKSSSPFDDEDEEDRHPVRHSTRISGASSRASFANKIESSSSSSISSTSDEKTSKQQQSTRHVQPRRTSSRTRTVSETNLWETKHTKRLTPPAHISSSSSSSQDEDEDVEYDANASVDVEFVLGQANKTETEWKKIMMSMNNSKVHNGSRWISDNDEEDHNKKIAPVNPISPTKEPRTERFLIKWRGLAYIHCSWELKEDILTMAKGAVDNVHRRGIQTRLSRAGPIEDGAYGDNGFNPDFTNIDRIIDTDKNGGVDDEPCYYVKWSGLGYEEATWETKSDLPPVELKQALELYTLRRGGPPPNVKSLKKALVTRPTTPPEMLKQSPVYKNGRQLRDYQVEAVNWLTFNWANKRNSILADEMGLGKTCQTVAYVKAVTRGPTLVVAPLATLPHWQREFEAWTDLNVVIYHGPEAARSLIREHEFYHPSQRKAKSWFGFDVVVTTYETVISDSSYLSRAPYALLVVDEAHRLKNRNSKLTKTLSELFEFDACLLLTGTPIQNNTGELWTLLNFIDDREFADLEKFEAKYGQMTTASQMDDFHGLLKGFLLRRFKSDVEATLPAKEELVIEVELTRIQRVFYRAIYEENIQQLMNGIASGSRINLNNIAMQLRKCCCHPYLIDGVEDRALTDEPPLVGEPWADHVMRLLVNASGKFILLDKLLPRLRNQNHRVLIFSQFTRVLDILEDYLLHRRFTFERIDGSVSGRKRQEAIDRFSSPESKTFCFLLSTRGCGQGINLTAADTVIMFDCDWNPQNDVQALARCHRIGQIKPVSVYRLVTNKTYEQEMFARASLKLGLDTAVMARMSEDASAKDADNESGAPVNVSDEELERMLKFGAYALGKDGDETESKAFFEADIDQILKTRTTKVMAETASQAAAQSTHVNKFSKASFVVAGQEQEVDVKDPEFWNKVLGEEAVKRSKVSPEHLGKGRRRRGQIRYTEVQHRDKKSSSDSGSSSSDGESGGSSDTENEEKELTVSKAHNLINALCVFSVAEWEKVAKKGGLRNDSNMIKSALGMILVCMCFRGAEITQECGEMPKFSNVNGNLTDLTAMVHALNDYIIRPETKVSLFLLTPLTLQCLRKELTEHGCMVSNYMLTLKKLREKPEAFLEQICEVIHCCEFAKNPTSPPQVSPLVQDWKPQDDAGLLIILGRYGYVRRRQDGLNSWNSFFKDKSLGWSREWEAVADLLPPTADKPAVQLLDGQIQIKYIGQRSSKLVTLLTARPKVKPRTVLPGMNGTMNGFSELSNGAVLAGAPVKQSEEWTNNEMKYLCGWLLNFGSPTLLTKPCMVNILAADFPKWSNITKLIQTHSEQQIVAQTTLLMDELKSENAVINKSWEYSRNTVVDRLNKLAKFWDAMALVNDDELYQVIGEKYSKPEGIKRSDLPNWWTPQHDFALVWGMTRWGLNSFRTNETDIFGPMIPQEWEHWPGKTTLMARLLAMLEWIHFSVFGKVNSRQQQAGVMIEGGIYLRIPLYEKIVNSEISGKWLNRGRDLMACPTMEMMTSAMNANQAMRPVATVSGPMIHLQSGNGASTKTTTKPLTATTFTTTTTTTTTSSPQRRMQLKTRDYNSSSDNESASSPSIHNPSDVDEIDVPASKATAQDMEIDSSTSTFVDLSESTPQSGKKRDSSDGVFDPPPSAKRLFQVPGSVLSIGSGGKAFKPLNKKKNLNDYFKPEPRENNDIEEVDLVDDDEDS